MTINILHFFRVLQCLCCLQMGLLGPTAMAQIPNASFTAIGHIESFTLNNPSNPLTSATMTVRGQTITIPSSLLIVMPGQYLTAHDIFRWSPSLPTPTYTAAPAAQSGLALLDVPPPPVPFEADIIGNIVGGVFIAGVVRISQGALHITVGFIQSVLPSGEFLVGPTPTGGGAGVRVRLNDPRGIYGDPSKLDARFSLDPDNSPVHAKTGFPVCIPRTATDPGKCPAGNRPADPALRYRFTCGAGAPASVDALSFAGCNPWLPVPLAIGDYVSVVGMLSRDATGFLVSAHGLDAEIGIYTSPRVDPAYIYIEEALQGSKGERFPTLPQEETTRFRIVGFTTDPSRNIDISLVDSGLDETGTTLSGPGGLTPSNLAQLGRFRNTWPAKDNARKVRRDVRAKIIEAADTVLPKPALAPASLTPGSYTAPVAEYIYPEITQFGARIVPGVGSFPIPVPFENFCFLSTAGATIKTVGDLVLGKLEPFPSSGRAASQVIGVGPQRVCGD